MSGCYFLICNCVACNTPMTANPNYCPSIRVNGSREPLCRACFTRWNQIHRIDKGLEPIPLHPNAYELLSGEHVASLLAVLGELVADGYRFRNLQQILKG